jgi:branched-chain amino acid transport system substrate-binding protein
MRLLLCGVAVMVLSVSVPASGQQPSIKVAIVNEFTGGNSGSGTGSASGAMQAAEEINAKGGILGRKIEYGTFDTQSDPPTGVAVMRRALNDKPFVVWGPGFSPTTLAAMPLAQQAGIPQITAAEAAVITERGNPNIFRVSFTQVIGMAKLAKWMAEDLKAESVAVIWENDAFGKGGWDSFNAAWQARGKSVVLSIPTEFQQVDYTAELTQVKRSGAKNLFIYLTEDGTSRLMTQLRKMGLQFDNIIGESTLCTEQVINLAKEAVEGVKCHVGLTASAPLPGLEELGKRFEARFKRPLDHNVLKGYLQPYVTKAVVEATGGFDQEKFRSCLHGMYLEAAKEPELLMDVYYDDKGDIDRQSFLTEVKSGKNIVTKLLPMLRADHPRKSCK